MRWCSQEHDNKERKHSEKDGLSVARGQCAYGSFVSLMDLQAFAEGRKRALSPSSKKIMQFSLLRVHCRRFIFILSLPCGEQRRQNPAPVKYWEIIADNLSKAGWSWGCVSAIRAMLACRFNSLRRGSKIAEVMRFGS